MKDSHRDGLCLFFYDGPRNDRYATTSFECDTFNDLKVEVFNTIRSIMSNDCVIPLYQIDAFSKTVFHGNPAAVCVLERWLSDPILQNIAAENNLSETAFIIVQSDKQCQIRWFTPSTEVELCGHATLAAAYVIFQLIRPDWTTVHFISEKESLDVELREERFYLNFPSLSIIPWTNGNETLKTALGIEGECEIFKSRYDAMVVLERPDLVMDLKPDMKGLCQIAVRGIIVTSIGNDVDFVSRFFAPRVGIDEDPVTGSAHCVLIPYWAERLNKKKLVAKQVSKRSGILFCEDFSNGRVEIGGHAALYSRGEIAVSFK